MGIVFNVIRRICLVGSWGIFGLFGVGLFIAGSNIQTDIQTEFTKGQLNYDKCLTAIYEDNLCPTEMAGSRYICIEDQEKLCKKSHLGKPAPVSRYINEWWYPYLQFILPAPDVAQIFIAGFCCLIFGGIFHILINWVFKTS